MKCDKHGIEMEWRGSLMKGGMYCVGCELDSAGSEIYEYAQFDKAVLDELRTTGGRYVPGEELENLARPYIAPPMPNPVPPPRPRGLVTPRAATSVAQARGRMDDAQQAQTALSHGGGLAYCPYCEKPVGVAHFGPHNPQGTLCYKEYCRDMDIIQRGHV